MGRRYRGKEGDKIKKGKESSRNKLDWYKQTVLLAGTNWIVVKKAGLAVILVSEITVISHFSIVQTNFSRSCFKRTILL